MLTIQLGSRTGLICYVNYFFVGGAFKNIEDTISPFGYKRGEGVDAGAGEIEWVVNKDRSKYDAIFDTLGPIDGKVTGASKLHQCNFSPPKIASDSYGFSIFV